jgi:hypothetical protein
MPQAIRFQGARLFWALRIMMRWSVLLEVISCPEMPEMTLSSEETAVTLSSGARGQTASTGALAMTVF